MSLKNIDRAESKRVAAERFKKLMEDFKSSSKETIFKFFERIPERYKRNWLACYNGTASKRKAIAAKCHECAGYEDVTNNVGGCTARTCPLWKYRPNTKG